MSLRGCANCSNLFCVYRTKVWLGVGHAARYAPERGQPLGTGGSIRANTYLAVHRRPWKPGGRDRRLTAGNDGKPYLRRMSYSNSDGGLVIPVSMPYLVRLRNCLCVKFGDKTVLGGYHSSCFAKRSFPLSGKCLCCRRQIDADRDGTSFEDLGSEPEKSVSKLRIRKPLKAVFPSERSGLDICVGSGAHRPKHPSRCSVWESMLGCDAEESLHCHFRNALAMFAGNCYHGGGQQKPAAQEPVIDHAMGS